jgi:5-methylcytosine-specific restriction enzyme subunit McrC
VADQVRRRFGQVNRLECVYDDHHADIVDNQILHTALALCRKSVQHPYVRGRVSQLADTFLAACSPLSGDWREVRAGMAYNRLNTRYQEAHTLAWFVLDGLGVNDLLAAGSTHGSRSYST